MVAAADLNGLLPIEATAVAVAVPARRQEFATGRALLRELLGTDQPIAVLPSRAPALPDGWVGSLAHDGDLAVAAVVPAGAGVVALGVDVEAAGAVGREEAGIVLRPDEAGIDPTVAFVLKEAAYKAWSNLSGRVLEHHEVRLALAGDHFAAEVLAPSEAVGAVLAGRTLAGRWCEAAGRVLALAAVGDGARTR